MLKTITHNNLRHKVEFRVKTEQQQELGNKPVWVSWGKLWSYVEESKKTRKNQDGIIEYYESISIVIRYKSRIDISNELQAVLPDGRICKVIDWGNMDKTGMKKNWTLIKAITND